MVIWRRLLRNAILLVIAGLASYLILHLLIEGFKVDEKQTPKGLVVSQPDPEF